MTSTGRGRALILLPSARELLLAKPRAAGKVSVGFWHVELGPVLRAFENRCEFVFATLDGRLPQVDVNGLSLAFHSIENIGNVAAMALLEQQRSSFDIDAFRRRHSGLVARRDLELRSLEQHLGRVPVSQTLPNTEREVATFRAELVGRLSRRDLPVVHSFPHLVHKHRDPLDDFSFADFDFLHSPGGHAAMVDFRGNPWLGEILHAACRSNVLISLISRSPIALTSTWLCIDKYGDVQQISANPFLGASITATSKNAERLTQRIGHLNIPGYNTRVSYYIDDVLKNAGFSVHRTLNPSAPKVIYDSENHLLTGNGPQAIDYQVERIRQILD
ncbi:Uncharacterised protein [Mycobacteroides abscessus]|nr:Uncharacterised protein [Mycobacteroides abscessus]